MTQPGRTFFTGDYIAIFSDDPAPVLIYVFRREGTLGQPILGFEEAN
jgi:hypothetical protein